MSVPDELVTLAEAVGLYKRETGYSNAYAWYRSQAARDGRVHLGESVPATKSGGRWFVRRADLDGGIAAVRRRREAEAQAADDYKEHVLHGSDGARVHTNWGYYDRRGPFHFAHYDSVPPWKTDGTWICSTCWSGATTEHDRPECHTCEDWGGCGRDCTLSAVRCDPCGHRLVVWSAELDG